MDTREARWAAVYGAVVAEALAERRRGGFVPDQHEMRNIVVSAWGAANEAEAELEKSGLVPTSEPGKVAP